MATKVGFGRNAAITTMSEVRPYRTLTLCWADLTMGVRFRHAVSKALYQLPGHNRTN